MLCLDIQGGMNQRARNSINNKQLVFLRNVLELLVTANVPSSLILSTLNTVLKYSSEISVLSRPTRCHISEDGIRHSHRHEDLKYYIALTGWALTRRSNVFHVRYELCFYISDDGILYCHRWENFKILHSINRLGSVAEKWCVSCEVRTVFLHLRWRHSLLSPPRKPQILHTFSYPHSQFTAIIGMWALTPTRLLPSRNIYWRMPSSGMLRRVDLIRTEVSEDRIASIIRATRICELGTTLAESN
jgi:hypothetical protein